MVPTIPSFSNATIFAISLSCPRIGIHSPGCSIYGRSHNTLQKRYILPQSLPFKLFQKYRSGYGIDCSSRIQIVASVGTNVATDEPNPAISDGGAETSEPLSASNGPSETPSSGPRVTSNAQSKRPRSTRKSDMPPVKKEELVPGASFVGKVRSIQPFGAFVDIGAFTDGLVHVSNLSNEFVKDVGSIVSVGQEVTVQILEANMETRRISLTMRDNDDTSKSQQGKDTTPATNEDKPKTPRKNAPRFNKKREELQKSKKFVKGQVLDGTVKNLTRSGAFISLPDGEEGFLPSSEESEGFTVLGTSSLQVGQEVNVRVLRVTRGQVTLTMKKEDDLVGLNMKLNQGVVHTATNPFELAFRKNTEIAAFLEEREKVRKSSEPLSSPEAPKERRNVVSDSPAASAIANEDETFLSEQQSGEATELDPNSSKLVGEGDDSSKPLILKEDVSPVDSVVSDASVATDENELDTESEPADKDEPASLVSQEHESAERTALSESLRVDGEKDDSAIASIVEDEASAGHDISAEAEPPATQENLSAAPDESLQAFQAKDDSATVLIPEEKSSTGNDPSAEAVSAADSSVEDELKETDSVVDSTGHSDDKSSSSDNAPDVTAKDSADDSAPIPNEVTPASEDAISTISSESAADTRESSTKASISPALVKQLREETGAGMMDCKKALAEAGGDIVKAQEILRQKGLASADKRASRTTAEGRIGSYIHDNRIGVLIEVNCETDFVSRGDMFRELVDDLAMQIAACPQVHYLAPEDVPEETITKERDIELQKEDILAKPEQIRSKIVDGRIRKRLEELALLEQPYIKNDKLAVKDLVRQTIATVGENIKVKRFVCYNLGEGLEKRSQDFAAEVAEQTAARQAPAVQKEKPAETNETTEKSPAVAVSAALVKQLREETGAGMMDCKKALKETGGNLEKAQEYLRKKGLSSADKKSSRLAAEGCISSYIHDSRIGVLIEVNSETDFVGRSEKFRELVDDLAMQVAACPQVDFISMEDIPQGIVSKEKEIEMQREDLKSKPENIREKIVEGRVAKRLGELALSEQPFIKDDSVLVKDLVKQTVAALGENIKIRRFSRFTLGESAD